jgi:hypothetical protein
MHIIQTCAVARNEKIKTDVICSKISQFYLPIDSSVAVAVHLHGLDSFFATGSCHGLNSFFTTGSLLLLLRLSICNLRPGLLATHALLVAHFGKVGSQAEQMNSNPTVGRTRWALEELIKICTAFLKLFCYPEGDFFAQLAVGNFICILISKKLAKLSHRPRPNVNLLLELKK